MKKSVRLILGSDEECGSGDLEYYYAKEQEAPYTFTPDADFPLINIEKGSFKGVVFSRFSGGGCKGLCAFPLQSGDKVNVVPARATLDCGRGSSSCSQKQAAARVDGPDRMWHLITDDVTGGWHSKSALRGEWRPMHPHLQRGKMR